MITVNPMLAAGGVDEYWLRKAMKDKDWVAEVKYDGSRYVASFEKDRIYYHSRRTSVKDDLKVEKGLNLSHINKAVKELTGTVLDGEVMGPDGFGSVVSIMGSLPDKAKAVQEKSGYAVYKVFDILFYKGEDVQDLPLKLRRNLLKKALDKWNGTSDYVSMVEQSTGREKQDLYDRVIASGGEGIILKNLEAPYVQGTRKKEYWVKVKKQKDYSVVITGFDYPEKYSVNVKGERTFNRFWALGWIAAIKYGLYKHGQLVEVGRTSGMADSVRKDMSKHPKNYVGKAMDIIGQEILKAAIRHPRYIRMRPDVEPESCKWEDFFGKNKV